MSVFKKACLVLAVLAVAMSTAIASAQEAISAEQVEVSKTQTQKMFWQAEKAETVVVGNNKISPVSASSMEACNGRSAPSRNCA